MNIETTLIKKITIKDLPDLDPISVYIEEPGAGKGSINISCYGDAWTAYWGGMGKERSLPEFFCSCNSSYLIGCLAPSMNSEVFSGEELFKMARKSILDRRRGLSPDYDNLSRDKARELYNRTEDLEGCETMEQCPSDLMFELFGPEWWHAADNATDSNPRYVYLSKIIEAVQEAFEQSILIKSR